MDKAIKKEAALMDRAVEIAQELWQHKLFRDVVDMPSFSYDDLAISICEKKIRLIQNMPSSSDESASQLIDGYGKIVEQVVKCIEEAKAQMHFY